MGYDSYLTTNYKLRFVWEKTDSNQNASLRFSNKLIKEVSNINFSKNVIKYDLIAFTANTFFAQQHFNIVLDNIPLNVLASAYIIDRIYTLSTTQTALFDISYHVKFHLRSKDNTYFLQVTAPSRSYTNTIEREFSLYIPCINQIYSIQKFRV